LPSTKRQRRRIRWALGNQRGVGPALAAVEGFVADTIREFAGELVPADAFARGQIREGSLPADGFGAAGAEMPSSTQRDTAMVARSTASTVKKRPRKII